MHHTAPHCNTLQYIALPTQHMWRFTTWLHNLTSQLGSQAQTPPPKHSQTISRVWLWPSFWIRFLPNHLFLPPANNPASHFELEMGNQTNLSKLSATWSVDPNHPMALFLAGSLLYTQSSSQVPWSNVHFFVASLPILGIHSDFCSLRNTF